MPLKYIHLSSAFHVLYSGSMEPAFYRGDILFLTNVEEDPIRVGDIVVFKIDGREIPIVHRTLRVHERFALVSIYFHKPIDFM